jgi:putative DNA primase/helicase
VPYFRGLDVRINQDNDAPGKDHALDVAHKLFGTAKSIKVIPPFPGVPEGGDFKDWIAAGGTKEEYLRIVEETSIQNSDETSTPTPGSFVGILPFKSVGDLFEETDEDIPWVVGGLLATGNITEISGTAKLSGKTTLLLDMASCLLEGQPFLDIPTVRSNVAFLIEQGNNLKEALEIAGISPDTKGLHILQYKDVRGRKWVEIAEQVCEYCKQNDIGVLIVDTLVEFGQIEDENLVGPVKESMQNLKKAAQNYGLAVAYTRHHNKQNQGRGSSQFEADCDFYFTLKRPEGNHKDTVRVLHGEGRSRDRIKNLYIELQEGATLR